MMIRNDDDIIHDCFDEDCESGLNEIAVDENVADRMMVMKMMMVPSMRLLMMTMMPMLTKTTLEAGHDGDFVALGCAPESCNIVKS